jgi:ubiquinone/menaquinone biosynthesis C-methylase UbiE
MHDIALRRITEQYAQLLGENDASFLARIFAHGLQPYRQRLEALGFVGARRVLDAGCGFGQWSLALASLNEHVDACDASAIRLVVLRELAQELAVDGIAVRHARLERLPYADASYELAFCYGVIFCTPWRESLAELARILVRGGRLYVNANDIGWTVHLWQTAHNATADYDPRAVAARNLANTLAYTRGGLPPSESQIVVSSAELTSAGEALGLRVVAAGGEGMLHLSTNAAPPTPFFKAEYHGLPGCHEVVFEKP